MGQTPLFGGAAGPSHVPAPAPPRAPAKGKGKKKTDANIAADAHGRRAWLAFDECIILTEQHRFTTATEDGRQLHDIVQKLSSDVPGGLSRQEVEELCATLNACVASPSKIAEMLTAGVTVVALRNSVRAKLSLMLAKHDARTRNERLVVWSNPHTAVAERTQPSPQDPNAPRRPAGPPPASRPLSSSVHRVLEGLHPKGVMPAVQFFYSGARYHFMDTKHPAVNWVTNNVCIGRKLILHPDEPEDDLSRPYRVLRYLPVAIHVEPNGLPLGDLCGDGSPTNCIPVTPVKSARIPVSFPHKTLIHPPTPAREGTEYRPPHFHNKVTVQRHGFMLESANAVTDYFAQGMSFRGKPNLLHITPPPGAGNHYNRGNLLVTVSRPSLKSELNLLTPMWRPGDDDDKQRVIKSVMDALTPSDNYLAEKARLQSLSMATWDKHYERLCRETYPPSPPTADPRQPPPTPHLAAPLTHKRPAATVLPPIPKPSLRHPRQATATHAAAHRGDPPRSAPVGPAPSVHTPAPPPVGKRPRLHDAW